MYDSMFNWMDYLVFLGTLVSVLLIGFYYAFIDKQITNYDILLGGGTMSVLPVAISIMATYISATVILGIPAEVYYYGTLIINLIFEIILFGPIGCFIYVPVFYKLKLTSVNEYLELRFNSVVVRWLGSATFIAQMTFYMGIVLFAPSLAMEAFLGLPMWASILVMGSCAAIYTAIGGFRAVVWTDVFQVIVILLGMLTILIKCLINVGGLSRAFEIAQEHGRLQLFDFNFSPFIRQTTWGLFFGHGLLSFTAYPTYQPQVQRYSSMGTLRSALMAMLLNIPLFIIIFGLSLLIGVALFAFYAGCDPIKLGKIQRADQLMPFFVVEQLSMIQGMMGLFLSCLFSASLSTVSSGLNSVAAVTWEDFLLRKDYFRNMEETKQATVTKLISFCYGAFAIAFAFIVSNRGPILTIAIKVSGAIIGPLGGVFFLGLFIPFVDKWGAASGVIVSHIITIWICIGSMIIGSHHIPMPTNIDKCSVRMMTNFTMHAVPEAHVPHPKKIEVEWPQKIYTISYILYSGIGILTCIIVGIVVSLFTGSNVIPEDKEQLYHPSIVKLHKYLQSKVCK